MTTPDVRITPLLPQDLAGAIALWRVTPGIGLSGADAPDALASFLSSNADLCFAAHANDRLIGTVLCGTDGRRGYIYHLAVSDPFRGRGLGRKLVERVEAALIVRGVERAHAVVYADNPEGRAVWDALGWQFRENLVLYSRYLIPE